MHRTLNDVPDLVLNLVRYQPNLPIVIIWNSDIVFQEVYRTLRTTLLSEIDKFQDRPELHTFYVNDLPVIRFFKHPEVSVAFSAKTIIDISVYQKTLEKHPYNEERQIGVDALAARLNARMLKIEM